VVTNFELFFSSKAEVAGECTTLDRMLFFFLLIHQFLLHLPIKELVKFGFIKGGKATRRYLIKRT
jgi:hypothetical protein